MHKVRIMSPEMVGIKKNSTVQKNIAVNNKPAEIHSPHSPFMNLQRELGNYAFGHMIQAKLKINEPGDAYEQEADRIAEQVMRMPDPGLSGQNGEEEEFVQAKPVAEHITTIIQKQYEPEEDEEEDELLQAKPVGPGAVEISPDIASSINSLKGGGQPLSDSEKNFFEPRFGCDFSLVRVHTGINASESARSVNARAYTVGHDIFFGMKEYTPETQSGRRLMAHELTHTIQQQGLKRNKEQQEARANATLIANESGSYGGVHSTGLNKNSPMSSSTSLRVQRALSYDDFAEREGVSVEDRLHEDSMQTNRFPRIRNYFRNASGQVVDIAGKVISRGSDFFRDRVHQLAPKLAPLLREIRQKGILGFLKDKISSSINRIFDGLKNNGGVLGGLVQLFEGFKNKTRHVVAAFSKGDCEPLFAAMTDLKDIAVRLAGNAWDAITNFAASIGDKFSRIWQKFGAPVVDWLSSMASDVWAYINKLGSEIWEWSRPIRERIGGAWNWIKEQLGVAREEILDNVEGIGGWIMRKAGEAWDSLKEQLKPLITTIKAVGESFMSLLPMDAIHKLRENIQEWLNKAMEMAGAMDNTDNGVIENQISLRDRILPAVLSTIGTLRNGLVDAGEWMAAKIGDLGSAVLRFTSSIASIPLLDGLTLAVQWIQQGVVQLVSWSQNGVVSLFTMIGDGLVYLTKFIDPILKVLKQIVDTLFNLLGKLPDLVLGPAWWLLPCCIKTKIKDFIVKQILGRIPLFNQFMAIPNLWAKMKAVATRILTQIFVDGNLFGAAWTFFCSILEILKIPSQLVVSIVQNALKAFSDILNNPLGFFNNFLKGFKQGFVQFFNKVDTHLLNGVTGWLFGQLKEAGIAPPADFSFKSILGFIFNVLGISVNHIFELLAKKIGETRANQIKRAISFASGVWSFIKDVVERGPVAIWDKIQEQLSNLWNMILSSVTGWIKSRIIERAIKWLLSLLDVTGIMPVVNALISIYKSIESFIRYLKEMLEIMNRVVVSLAEIARGEIKVAANNLEKSLANSLTIGIGFLANQFGLNNLGNYIREMVGTIREYVDKGIMWLIEKAVAAGTAIFEMAKSLVGAVKNWWEIRKDFMMTDGKKREFLIKGTGKDAEIFVKTNPEDKVEDFLDKLIKEYNLKESDVAEARSKAIEIDEEKAKENDVPEEKKPEHDAKMNSLIDELIKMLQDIKMEGTLTTNSDPIYGPTRNGFGTYATRSYMAGEQHGGSEAFQDKTDIYKKINKRRYLNGAYYVRGHLLNAKLGGIGDDWKNLTPLFKLTNYPDMYHQFEEPLKNALTNGGYVKDFKVEAVYESKTNTDHINILKNEGSEEYPDHISESLSANEVIEALEAEQYVPSKLICEAKVKKDKEPETVEEIIKPQPLENPIKPPCVFEATEKTQFNISDIMEPYKEENKEHIISSLKRLNGIGDARAEQAYVNWGKGKRNSYLELFGITRKRLQNLNRNYVVRLRR